MYFFFYGTLRDAAVRRAVLGTIADRLTVEPALLADWYCTRIKGRHYPVILPRHGHSVDGCVVWSLPASAIVRLDRFEGPEYKKTQVDVVAASGDHLSAQTYVGSRSAVPSLQPWHFDEWVQQHREGFVRSL